MPMTVTTANSKKNTVASPISNASGRISRSKDGPDNLVGRIKQEQRQFDEHEALDFLNEILGEYVILNCENLHDELKDGVLLCNLVNKLRPGTIKHVGQRDLSFVKMDNITRFLQGARQLGLNDSQLFETIDLFEAKDMQAVIRTILVIARRYHKSGTDREQDGSKEFDEHPGGKEISLLLQPQQPVIKEMLNDAAATSDCTSAAHEEEDDAISIEFTVSSAGGYRDVRDVFGSGRAEHDNDMFVRPPRSPLRPMPKAQRRQSSDHRQHQRRKSAEDLRATQRRPSAPAFSSQSKAHRDVTVVPCMSRTSSASSCRSYISSATSIASETPPTTPPSTTSQRHRKSTDFEQSRNSPLHQPPQQKSDSLRHKLDQQLFEYAGTIEEETKIGEKLLLKSKDGQTRIQYQLGNCIGKGQFGSVYRALDLTTGETVAVKRIKLEDPDIDQEIMKEVALLKTLSHSNVIQYLGFIKSRNHMNIVLEYVENGSLMSTLKAFGAFPEKLVASFCIKILNGLEYLHANDVVHCDLKAANILTTKTGDVKLSDFGVSLNLKIKGADTGTVSGTPNWMAPEVIELRGASPKSDIWSLGCTLVELITGKPPYADMIAMSAMFHIVEDNYPPLPKSMSQEMHSFLLCCFQKNPDDRPTATQLKEHTWLKNHQRRMKKSSTLTSYLEQRQRSSKHHHHRKRRTSSGVTTPSPAHKESCHPLDPQHQRTAHKEQVSTSRPVHEHTLIEADSGLIDEDYTTHRFVHTSFGKAVECKVCGELIKSQTIFCEVCALICHEGCKKLAFSCPPKVKDQQPSYDWVFSAKIYNRGRQDLHGQPDSSRSQSVPEITWNRPDHLGGVSLENHPQVENIRKYSLALGLTPQEQRALCENQALLSHTLALQDMDPEAVERLIKKRSKNCKKNLVVPSFGLP
ncbi:kinase-like domain-containing protein [Dichotomocladium elegans]|nr:kinase-like domain-containing protein [Dichotomocladium elegans]